jgi:DNA-binding NarL/FixJ family response regulator
VSAEGRQLLLIEDNPGDVDLVRSRLVEGDGQRECFFNVRSEDRLSSGLKALLKERPAVILLDLYLPDSQGAETIYNVLSQAAGVPVVVLSGRDDEELVLDALQHGAQDYLVKGAFNSKQLWRSLRCAIERQALITALGMNWREQMKFTEQSVNRVSYGLRNELNSIHQAVIIAIEDPDELFSVGQRKRLEGILRSIERVRSMVTDRLEAAWGGARRYPQA